MTKSTVLKVSMLFLAMCFSLPVYADVLVTNNCPGSSFVVSVFDQNDSKMASIGYNYSYNFTSADSPKTTVEGVYTAGGGNITTDNADENFEIYSHDEACVDWGALGRSCVKICRIRLE